MSTQDNRIKVQFNADGTQSLVSPDGTVVDTIAPGTPDAEISPAMALLNRLQTKGQTPIIRTLTVDGEKYPIRQLCWGGLNKFGMLTPRDENGELMLDNEEDSTSLMAAVLFTGVATSDTDPTPFFATWQEAHTFARNTSPNIVRALGQIFHGFLAQNTTILPEAKREPVAFDDEELDEKKELS